MSNGHKNMRRVQFGREATSGAAVTPTTLWRGLAVGISNDSERVLADENIGVATKTTRQYTPRVEASLSLPSTEATFEQVDYIYDAGVAKATATQDGSGSGYIREHVFPTFNRSATDLTTLSVVAGDDKKARKLAYGFVSEIELSGAVGEAWKISAKIVGRERSDATFATVSVPSVETMLFSKTKLYIDDVSGTIGSTEKTCTLKSATLKISGLFAMYAASGELYFCEVEDEGFVAQLDLVYTENDDAVTEENKADENTPRLIRLLTEGNDLATAGTTYSKKTHIIDACGVYTAFNSGDGDDNGIVTVSCTLELGYNETAAMVGKIITVNELSTLP